MRLLESTMFGKFLMGAATIAAFAGLAQAENYNWGNVRFDGGGFVSAVIFHPKAENLYMLILFCHFKERTKII